MRGHEFHYSQVEPTGEPESAWRLAARGREWDEGIVAGSTVASYLHLHWAAHPRIAERLAKAAAAAPAAA